MPKRIFEIPTFDRGIMSSPEDELDIPANAATYSLNIDPLTSGELRGVPKSNYLKKTGFTATIELTNYNRPTTYSYPSPTSATTARNDQHQSA
tara:strand:- start:6966 stop:7244 length:279 start_codon:yes stop_codon:yes gene_type:complete